MFRNEHLLSDLEDAFFVLSTIFITFANNINYDKMNKIISLVILAVMAGGLVSCSQKKDDKTIITTKPVKKAPLETQKIGDYEQVRKIEWVGSVYSVKVIRKADVSLPVVIDTATENKFYDNTISVTIYRNDGTVFFNRIFKKDDFAEVAETGDSKHTALLGIVLDKAEGDNLIFAASVGAPDKMSDEYVPLVLKISRFGAVSITKDTQLDTSSSPDKEETGTDAELEAAEEEGI